MDKSNLIEEQIRGIISRLIVVVFFILFIVDVNMGTYWFYNALSFIFCAVGIIFILWTFLNIAWWLIKPFINFYRACKGLNPITSNPFEGIW